VAGKVKNKDDGGTQSKTARASMRTGGQKEAFIASADATRIVPLGGGTHAYVLDPRDGRTHRFTVASEQFIGALIELAGSNHGDRLRRDLADLATRFASWETVSARLDAALAPQAPEAETPEVDAA
jgi:hypothetical protein